MQDRSVSEDTMNRIQRMESYFDAIQTALATAPSALRENPSLREMLRALTQYYKNGQWLADYECDERGGLPPGLKRGVLSQDGVWNLLSDLERLCPPGRDTLKSQWLDEEAAAQIHGWDFSHIRGRYSEEDGLPWDYRSAILRHLRPEHTLLDIDTGGGEFLLSLGHPYENTAATEAFPPNVSLCEKTLRPLGIDFRPANGKGPLPFPDGSFDLVIDRHGDFNAAEIFRILKPGGLFLTQQVGAENDRELVGLLLPGTPLPFPDQYLDKAADAFRKAGFEILEALEAFRPIRFYDVGALVWFARIIEWEFPGFSVEGCLDRLYAAQERLEIHGSIEGTIHRFFLIVRKP